MKKMSSILAASVLGISVLLSGCSSSSEQGANQAAPASTEKQASTEKPKVSVVLKALNSEYWKLVERGAKDAAEKYEVDVSVMGPADETKVEEQVSMIQDQLTNNASALVLAPSQPTTVLNVLQQAKDNKIPVVLADSDADFPEKASFVGTENFDAGKQGGEYIASQLQKGDKVAIIRGQLGSKTHDDRTNGAQEALKAAGLDVVTVQPADSDRVKAMTVMENILQSNPDIKAVFTSSEDMALGALRAVQAKQKQIMIIGFDGTSEGLNSIKSGGLAGEVAQDPYNIGYLGVEAAVKAIRGETVEKRIDSGAKVITKENVEEALTRINQFLGK